MLTRLKIGPKLLLMLALPILGLLFFAARYVTDNVSAVKAIRQTRALTTAAVSVSQLIHEIQKERGMTAGFLASQGAKFRPELAKQRQETDAAAKKLQELATAQGKAITVVKPPLDAADEKFAKISDTRSAADALRLQGKESFAYYSDTIAAYLEVISAVSRSAGEPDLVLDATALLTFVSAKEFAGRERATLNGVFTANRFEDESYQRVLKIIATQEAYLVMFDKTARKDIYDQVRQKLAIPAASKVEELRGIALSKGMTGEFGVAPELWFATITEKINGMKDAEDLIAKNLVSAAEQHENSAKQALVTSCILTVVLILATLILGWLIAHNILTPLKRLVRMLTDIADGEGDLTKRLDDNRRDELGEVSARFNQFIGTIHNIISRVAATTLQVSSAATNLQETAEQIATAAEEVACQSTTVATASEEMSATSNDIARSCTMAAQVANEASGTANAGADIVHKTLTGMQQIAERVRTSAQTVGNLGARSDQIGAIVGTIQDIADQTNLLALNAAIEAARAGEQGRGFAVVADEVRALAERTTKATREISEMIKAIQTETGGAVATMESGVAVVEDGMANSQQSGESLQQILSAISEVTAQVHQIATAAEEQTATTSEISSNIHQITDVVQETATGAHATAKSAAHLKQLSGELESLVNRFKLT